MTQDGMSTPGQENGALAHPELERLRMVADSLSDLSQGLNEMVATLTMMLRDDDTSRGGESGTA